MTGRLHDPTEANRRRRARERLRDLSQRARPSDEPIRVTLLGRAAMLLLGVILLTGSAMLANAASPPSTPKPIGLIALLGVSLIALPGLGLLAVALLPERIGAAILKAMMSIFGWIIEGLGQITTNIRP